MNTIKVKVNFTQGTCETTGINLITGDYNSTKLVFEFDREDGTKVFEMKSPSEELVMVQEIQNNEIVLYGEDENENIASIFNEEGYYVFEISLYENESKLTSAKGKIKVKPEQVVVDGEVVEAYLPIFDQLLSEVNTALAQTNNLNLSSSKSGKITTITITRKDGTSYEVEVLDGEQGPQGETGPAGAIGTPLVASSISGMTDTTRNYINTTDGKWYYYDGSDWLQGGVYQATEISSSDPIINQIENELKNKIIETITFNRDLVSFDSDGYLYKVSDLPTTHQNYIWLKTDKKNLCGFTVEAKKVGDYDLIRPAIKFKNGYTLLLAMTYLNNNFNIDFYNQDTTLQSGATKISNVGLGIGVHKIRIRKFGKKLFIYIDNVLAYTFENAMIDDIKNFGVNFRGSNNQSYYGNYTIEEKQIFAHMSLDDQLTCLQTLTNNKDNYNSIFDCSYFAPLKTLHDEYGCKFTLMLFSTDSLTNPTFSLSQVTDKFKNEFAQNSDWLRFAYHGADLTTRPSEQTTSALIDNMQTVYTQIKRFASEACIDKVPRMSYFNCTKEQVLSMKENDIIYGLLTADDDRTSNVGLNATELEIMQNYDTYTDYINNISYFRTEERLDITSQSEKEQIINNLNTKWCTPGNTDIFIIFAHSINTTLMKEIFADVAEWLFKKGFKYDYPMNRIGY